MAGWQLAPHFKILFLLLGGLRLLKKQPPFNSFTKTPLLGEGLRNIWPNFPPLYFSFYWRFAVYEPPFNSFFGNKCCFVLCGMKQCKMSISDRIVTTILYSALEVLKIVLIVTLKWTRRFDPQALAAFVALSGSVA